MKMIIDEFEKAHQMPTLPNYFPSKSLFSIVKVTSNVQIIQNQRSTGKMYELSEFLRMIIIEHRHHRKKKTVCIQSSRYYFVGCILVCHQFFNLPYIFELESPDTRKCVSLGFVRLSNQHRKQFESIEHIRKICMQHRKSSVWVSLDFHTFYLYRERESARLINNNPILGIARCSEHITDYHHLVE